MALYDIGKLLAEWTLRLLVILHRIEIVVLCVLSHAHISFCCLVSLKFTRLLNVWRDRLNVGILWALLLFLLFIFLLDTFVAKPFLLNSLHELLVENSSLQR